MVDKKTGLIVISGCPRSGTSVCMDIQRAAHGEDNILGYRFPQDEHGKTKPLLGPERLDTPAVEYLMELRGKKSKDKADYKDLNPNGFFEMEFTVGGIRYLPRLKHIFDDISENLRVCKVVSNGLFRSNPDYINRVIYMLRNPEAVAKSQERLKRRIPATTAKIDDEKMVIHTPEMFIRTSIMAAHFFLNNPCIPVLFIGYDDLMSKPAIELERMQEFVDTGDYNKASDIVDTSLNRSSNSKRRESSLWDEAWYVYNQLLVVKRLSDIGEDYTDILQCLIDWYKDPKLNIHREGRTWFCARCNDSVNESVCKLCTHDTNLRENLKSQLAERGEYIGDWNEEPCLYECGFDLDRDPITVKESIENNFWVNK